MVTTITTIARSKGYSLAELEREAKLGSHTIYKWDESEPSVYKVYRVAQVLGTTIEELIV